jgi:tetratricopeptide (TPR) repeat protein
MAQMIFVAAKQRSKTAQAKNDKELAAQAKQDYASAFELYNEFLLQREIALMRTPDGQGTLRAIKARLTKCLLATGQFDKAIQTYEAITKDDAQMRDGSSWEELADCYVEKARNQPAGPEKKTLLKRSEEIYGRLAILLMQNQRFDEHTYRLLYKRAEVLLETEPDMLASFFKNMELRGHHPKWDEGKYGFASKFVELKAKLDTIVVPRK